MADSSHPSRNLRPWWSGIAAVVLLTLLVACAAPPPVPLHGRLAFDAWVDQHLTLAVEDFPVELVPSGECGTYSFERHLVMMNRQCVVDRYPPGAYDWLVAHVEGHGVDQALGFPFGNTPTGWEHGAQCVGEVVMGGAWPFPLPPDAGAYWDCPADQVARTQELMVQAGAW